LKKINEDREALLNQRGAKVVMVGREDEEPYERRWVVGSTVAQDGTVLNSPGLYQMIKDVEKLKVRPKLFPEKSLRKSSVFSKKKSLAQVKQELSDMAKMASPSEEELLKFKKERERKEKIISRFNEMAKSPEKKEPVDASALLEEINAIVTGNKKIVGLSKASQRLESIKSKDSVRVPVIEDPYILPEDIEYEFENVYDDFLEDIKTKQDALETIKLKYKKEAQKQEEEEAYVHRVRMSKRKVRRNSKGKEILPRTDKPDPIFD
jgi:hypothetical protein